MSAGRILLLLLVVGVVGWLVRSSGLLAPIMPRPEPGAPAAPADRARAAARAEGSRNSQAEAASRDLDAQAVAGRVSENMTPEQVRALLGSPDAVDAEATEAGIPRERWSYRAVGKTVVFENGVVVRVE